ncbi:peptide/nickel transport system substrate-binding protein [Microbacterium terrae]|uniref:Heme-binding protein A n=1 Tax=Microbacterium terrae TaxID=69369 RepID=A0A0M2HGR5_9MICO|nr:ABC transporter substrate-binding protein [Microbacterium terrae]KJL43509.1 Heme-binding protein A precursor [Microbacterium terrae]MBP1077889.1 peptide/nickel transport system substrate-binding protein [Microbacterium terrae]GLK00060.1 ABC transporter substrate-binding protein [Microbacterium terrae]
MLRRTSLTAAALLAAGALLLTACTGGGDTAPTETGEPDPSAQLTVGLVLEPTNLDIRHTSGAALEQILIDNIYQGLVTRTEDNEIEPALASEYEISTDGLTYTFTLNPDITFHSGDALSVDDVVTSYTEVKDDESLIGHGDFAGVASIAADGDSTVVITLTEPNQNFLFALTGPAGLVFKAGDETDLKTGANGTGPFLLANWIQGDSIELTRNDAYWADPAGVAGVVLQYIPDFTAGVNAALDGSLDVLTAVDPNLAPQLDGESGFTLTTGKTTDKGTLAFNNAKAPLDDVRVREALRLAINHDELVAAIGAGQPMYGPIPELDPGYEDLSDVVGYDPDRARELLDEAGVDDLDLTLTIPSFYGTTVAQVLVSDFNEVGVTLEVNQVEFATWLQDVYTNKDYDLSFVLHVEPRDFGNFANPDYYFQYDNTEVQELYAEALATVDADESAALLAEAARIVSEDHAADWLYNGATLTAVGTGVAGFPVDSINSRLDLSGVTVAE